MGQKPFAIRRFIAIGLALVLFVNLGCDAQDTGEESLPKPLDELLPKIHDVTELEGASPEVTNNNDNTSDEKLIPDHVEPSTFLSRKLRSADIPVKKTEKVPDVMPPGPGVFSRLGKYSMDETESVGIKSFNIEEGFRQQKYSSCWAGVTWGIILAVLVPILLVLGCIGYRLIKRRKQEELNDELAMAKSRQATLTAATKIQDEELEEDESIPYTPTKNNPDDNLSDN